MTRIRPTSLPTRWRHGLLAALSLLACWSLPASGTVTNTLLHSSAAFSQSSNGRTPADVFVTDAGVYELDAATKTVRVWQRSNAGLELLRPANETSFKPFTATQILFSDSSPQRFTGIDASGAGTAFAEPAGMARHPTENKFAVVSGGEYVENGGNKKIPSVQVYEFSETPGTGGALESVEIALADEFREAFFTTTNGPVGQILIGYTNIVTVTGTNALLGVSSNWIYVVSADPLVTRTNDWDNAELADHRPPPDAPVFPDEKYLSLEDGFEYPVVIRRTWFDGTTNVETRPLYDYVYEVTTNASFLSSATDVAFLGGAGLVVPISDCGYSEIFNDKQWDTDHWVTNVYKVSGLVVFDAANPSAQGLVFPCATNLPGRIAGVDVDPDTGDIYVAVPSASAVYRYNAPIPGDVSSWLTLADRTVIVQDPDFVAGIPSQPSSEFGYLSNPEDVSVWKPDAGTPILLAADRANNRVMAFDPNSTWIATNWIGSDYRPRLENGVPADPSIGCVVSTNAGFVTQVVGLEIRKIPTLLVTTNWFRVETPAFPLFAVAPTTPSLSRPDGVFGQAGSPVLAVAGGAGADVRLYEIALDELDSDAILSLSLYWPGPAVRGGFPGMSTRDFAVATNDAGLVVALWDAPHANSAATPYFAAMESDEGSNVLAFTIAPSRFPRSYTLSIAPSDGVTAVLSGTATVPAGETAGSFSFCAKDGVEFDCTNVVLWATNAAPDGVTIVRFATNEWCDAVAFAETNVYRATPLYDVSIVSAGGFSTNVALVVANEAPTITNAVFYGYVIPGDPATGLLPEIYLYGLGAAAEDVAADSSLLYLWWTTTNAAWAADNLDWATTNNDWAADVSAEWEYFNAADPAMLVTTNWVDYATGNWDEERQSWFTVSTNYASLFAGQRETAVDGLVTNGVDLYVARGVGMPLPFRYNVPNGPYRGYQGLAPGASWGTTPFVVVCTVIDKDGGASVVSFPQKRGAGDYDADWAWDWVNRYAGMPDGISGDEVPAALYRARFTAVSDTNVTFVVWVVSGTPAASDQLVLQSATAVTGAWERLRDIPAGTLDYSAGEAPVNVTPAGTGPVRFYRIVKP